MGAGCWAASALRRRPTNRHPERSGRGSRRQRSRRSGGRGQQPRYAPLRGEASTRWRQPCRSHATSRLPTGGRASTNAVLGWHVAKQLVDHPPRRRARRSEVVTELVSRLPRCWIAAKRMRHEGDGRGPKNVVIPSSVRGCDGFLTLRPLDPQRPNPEVLGP